MSSNCVKKAVKTKSLLSMVKVENAIFSPLLRIGSAGLVATRAANGKFKMKETLTARKVKIETNLKKVLLTLDVYI